MQSIQTVTRRYSIKKLLSAMPEWQRIKPLAELDEAWGTTDSDYGNRMINCIAGKSPKLGEQRLLAAMKVLDVSAEVILTPFEEETTRRGVKA